MVGPDPTDPVAEPAEIQSVSRAAQILRLFGPETPEITASEAAERLGLNRTTAYRYCTSLVAAGLLDRGVAPGSFVPGGLLLQVGAFALGRRKVVDLAPPFLRELSARTHLTAVLSLWGSSGPVVTRVEEDSTRTALVTVRVGTQLSFDTAQAKVFLAYHRDQLSIGRLLGNLPAPQRDELSAELERVRERGYAAAVDSAGIVAVGAPVFDEHGICAAIAGVGTDRTVSTSPDSSTVRAIVDTARALSKEMGAKETGAEPPAG
ncbi:MAG TPA: IclR family transcriptional regulator [Pseudonocardia sp.]|uniref:IclR family transcriptional regulator n=1 Tax=Pseudonocardia sp. TaxID=60912 RepID=UPI002B4B1BCD|nr:IclR family transcriptional regulator [Pseudonocardia sp.]HLU56668.1 IclR family transcriptional regulator [Pseudonocardia sp.]